MHIPKRQSAYFLKKGILYHNVDNEADTVAAVLWPRPTSTTENYYKHGLTHENDMV